VGTPQQVETSTLQRVLEAAEAHGRSPRRFGERYMAFSPLRDEKRRSVSIGLGDGGKVLIHDFGGGDTEATVQTWGLTMSDLFPQSNDGARRRVGGRLSPPKRAQRCNTPLG